MSDVSRETELARERYGQVPGLAEYADLLSTVGVERGLVGPREVPRIWSRHIANCAVVSESELVAPSASIIDVGSGAGLPGLVWALVRPDLRITLVEPLLRRSTFLSEVVAELDLGSRVIVERTRAEQYQGPLADVVTARAVAPLTTLVGWSLPLARIGGSLVALKGSSAADELAAAAESIRSCGGGTGRVEILQPSGGGDPATVVVVPRVSAGAPRKGHRR